MASLSAIFCNATDKCFGFDFSSLFDLFIIDGGTDTLLINILFSKLFPTFVRIPISSKIFSYSLNNKSISITLVMGLKSYIL